MTRCLARLAGCIRCNIPASTAAALALSTALFLSGWTPTGAMTIKKMAGGEADVETILLDGRIEEGDALALQGYIAKLPVGQKIVAHLNSTGGLVQEAIATGRVIHKNKIRTVVPSKASCLSACVVVFVGGRDWATGQPWQLKHSTARLGVHPFKRDYPIKEYTAADMSRAVAATLKTVLSYTEYWDEVGADYEFLYLQWSTSTKDVLHIPNERLLDLGIKVLDERSGEIIDAKAVKDRIVR
jgi:hypothetical protein